jgi:uncharacterized membrane protein YdbT with pleckstrin-like domain
LLDEDQILEIERPHSRLRTLYILRSLIFPPFTLFPLPYFLFRFASLRYRFDEEGVHMSWGVLFRREINLTYGRIQDIHLTSGVLQRWLGLADIHIQTASGSAKAEMTIEGLPEYKDIRDFLYSRMRGIRGASKQQDSTVATTGAQEAPAGTHASHAELVPALQDVYRELKAARVALEKIADRREDKDV